MPDGREMIGNTCQVSPPTVIVNCSQCHGGAVRQDVYAGSRELASAGVLSGYDMTPEAALTKLFCLLGSGLPTGEVRRRMELDIAGELTVLPTQEPHR